MLLDRIPKELESLYSDLSRWENWHVRWRWRQCPFPLIASFIPSQGRIVDIGCGRGLLANYLALTSPARVVTGIDSSSIRIRAARTTERDRKNVRFHQQDVRDLKIEEYDVIVTSDFLHHLPHHFQGKLIARWYEALPPGGLLLIEEQGNRPRWKWLSHFLIDIFLNLGRRQYYRYPEEWLELLRRQGFSVEAVPAHYRLPLPDIIFICHKPDKR